MEQHPQKHFRKRDAILTCLRSTTVHPSAEWIYEQLKGSHADISLATVYRNLSLFKKQGLITSLGTVDGVERFDGDTHPHVHYICTGCGKVMDLLDLHAPEELQAAAERSSGGRVETCQLTFQGVCGECQKQ